MNALENEGKIRRVQAWHFPPPLAPGREEVKPGAGNLSQSRARAPGWSGAQKRRVQCADTCFCEAVSHQRACPVTICSPQYSSALVDGSVLTVPALLSADTLNWLLGIFCLSNCSVDSVFLLSKCLLRGGVRMVCAFPSHVLELLLCTASSQVGALALGGVGGVCCLPSGACSGTEMNGTKKLIEH